MSSTPVDRLATPSVWTPLRQPLFRALWIASVASNVGTWMHDVGAAWLMTSLAPSPLMVALVQTATSLPMFLLALPAGALADIVDRRRLLLFTQTWMMTVALGLGVLTLVGATTPWTLLAFTFLLALGTALNAPAWQAIIPELVPRAELPAAVALSSMGINISRAIGPALGGFVVAATGPAMVFLLNAASFVGIVIVLARWQRASPEGTLPSERFFGAMRAGMRYARHALALRAVLARTAAFVLSGSALWALLPVVARSELGRGPTGYGVLLACIGVGAVAGAAILPHFRRQLSVDWLCAGATVLFAVATLALAEVRHFGFLCVVLLVGGAAWLTLLSSFNTAAQTAVPSWVRARALAVYMLVFFGGMTVGSTLWGTIATRLGIRTALIAAAGGLIVGLLAMRRYRLAVSEGLNLAPSLHWPSPTVVTEPELDQGPVLVMVEYRIDPAQTRDFLHAMRSLRLLRRRDGALSWGLYSDTAEPGRYVEQFIVQSWVEHLRQHQRMTHADRAIEDQARAFHIGDDPPRVSHFIYAYDKEVKE